MSVPKQERDLHQCVKTFNKPVSIGDPLPH